MNDGRVIFTESVFEEIERHARDAKDRETGGILIGPPPVEKVFLITHQLADKGDSKKTRCTYESDADHLQSKLKQLRRGNPELDYRGTWHKHPTLSEPSQQDLDQAMQILADPCYKVEGRLLMPIVSFWNREKIMEMTCYIIETGDTDFSNIPHEVKGDNDPDLAILRSLYDICSKKHHGTPTSGRFDRRLNSELQSLKAAGFDATVKQLDRDTIAIDVPLDDNRSLLAILPTEYPQNPPRLILTRQNRVDDVPWGFPAWSSAYMLSDLVRHYQNQSKRGQRIRERARSAVTVYSRLTKIMGR